MISAFTLCPAVSARRMAACRSFRFGGQVALLAAKPGLRGAGPSSCYGGSLQWLVRGSSMLKESKNELRSGNRQRSRLGHLA